MPIQKHLVPIKCAKCSYDAVHIHDDIYLCTDHYLQVMDVEFSQSIRELELNKNEMENV